MDEPTGSYAPRSPDLSGFSSFPPDQSAFYGRQQPYQAQASYYPPPPQNDAFGGHYSASGSHMKNEDKDWLPPATIAPAATANQAFPKFEEDTKPAPGEVEGIVVKTKFPVARIKRIVQADEDVGKVAQVTPVVVAKALELFMISLALKSADEAKARSSKKVTGAHLKLAVQKDEQFDFLNDIVSKLSDMPTSKKEKEEDTDGEPTTDGGGGKKRKGPTRRKRKEREQS